MKYEFQTIPSVKVDLPLFSEVRGQQWISYGIKNDWPDFIIKLYEQSAMNRTCIISKQDAVIGQGLMTKDPNKEYLLKVANRKLDTWNDIYDRVALDYILFGGFAINVIWDNAGENIAEIYHLDFSKVRSGNINPATDVVEEYFYCPKWEQHRKYKPKSYRAYDTTLTTEFPSQIYYYFDYTPGALVYPLSDYVGAVNDIQTDIETSKFHISNLNNGLNPSLWINMNNGIPSPQERQQIYDQITDGFSGTDKAGKFFLSFSDDPATAPAVTPLTSANDGYYLSLDARVTSRILTAHRITSPLLLGIRDGGSGLGNNKDEIVTAYSHFMQTVVRTYTQTLLKNFSYLLEQKTGEAIDLYVEPNKLFAESYDGTPQDTAQPDTVTVDPAQV